MGRVQSYILGGLGLIPFVLIVVSCFLSPPDKEIYSLLIYIYKVSQNSKLHTSVNSTLLKENSLKTVNIH